MNCKPGDLARYVGTESRSVGRIVLVLESSAARGHMRMWRVEPPLRDGAGKQCSFVADQALRPIRPGDGDDETLTWAGKPNELPTDVIREVTACN